MTSCVNSLPERRARGFTLLEMAIVVFVIGMLTAGLIGPVQTQLEARDRQQTRDYLARAAEALYGFAMTERRLPCPSRDGDGHSDPIYATPADGNCEVESGYLPWAELGIEPADAWGNLVSYRVREREFTVPAQNSACDGDTANELDLCARGDIVIETRGDNAASGEVEAKFRFGAAAAENVAAVLVSHGRNGYGALGADGVPRAPVPNSNRDEDENADGDENFISRGYTREQDGCSDDTDESSPLCEFDDMVQPIARSLLVSRLVSAGQLP